MKAPPPKESQVQEALVELLDTDINPQWRYTAIPAGEKRDIRTAMKLQRNGVKKGFPDFVFVHVTGAVFWLELKRPGTAPRLSPEQEDMRSFLMRGGNYFMTNHLDDAIIELTAMGIMRNVTVSA
jgi:hypothetical protein